MPISEKRLAANRANGALSRGPITPEGKARSSQNAIKHGLQSNLVVLRNENKEAYQTVLQSYYDRFKPVGLRCTCFGERNVLPPGLWSFLSDRS
jgi:hypothetical protein